MRRKIINGIKRVFRGINQGYKKTVIRLLYPNILVDRKTYIGRAVQLTALRGAVLDLRGVYVKDFAYLYADAGAKITIGKYCQVGMFNVIVAKNSITIGERTIIAEHVTIRDQDHEINNLDSFQVSPVTIGTGAWLASKVTVLKGVTIGDKCVIGANSVVTRDVPARSVAVGCPAKVIKSTGDL